MATCYNPDGTTSGGYACWNVTTAGGHAPCCFNDAYCYSSGWCLNSKAMTVYRGGCTDQSWESEDCVKHCTGGKIGGIYKCDDAGNAGCFASDCGTENQFQMASGSLLLSGPLATSVLAGSHYAFVATSGGSLSTVAVIQPSTVTVTARGSATDSAASSLNTGAHDDTPYGAGAMAGVGVGIGLPLLLALLTALFFLFRERKRNKGYKHPDHGIEKDANDVVSPPPASAAPSHGATQGMYDASRENKPHGQFLASQQPMQHGKYEIGIGNRPDRVELPQ